LQHGLDRAVLVWLLFEVAGIDQPSKPLFRKGLSFHESDQMVQQVVIYNIKSSMSRKILLYRQKVVS
jgi:hypothetical protein